MAKGTAMGVWRGKKGSSVFYYLRNSKNAQKQGIRERVYEISNPQSDGQTDQRMKMLPLQRLGAMLGVIVRRSWEGVDYGGKTWQKFLKANLGSNSTLPYIDKEDDRVIPGDIQISKGSLDNIELTGEDMDIWYSNLKCTGEITTWGNLSSDLISLNSNIEEGDQLTFVTCQSGASATEGMLNANYAWKIKSLIVDTNSTITLSQLQEEYNVSYFDTGSGVCMSLNASNGNSMPAAAIIHSRLSDAGKYLRSTQRLAINETLMAEWFSSTRHSAARRSYQRATGALSTNWPVDPDAEGGTSNSVPGSYTISGLTGDKATCNGKSCWVRRDEDTNELVAVYVTSWLGEPGNNLVDRSNNQAMSYTYQQSELPLKTADVAALASLPTITWDGEPTS